MLRLSIYGGNYMSGLTSEQDKLYKQLERAIEERKQIDQILQLASENDLRAVLTAAGTEYIAFEHNGQSYTLTPLGYAICKNDQKGVEAILDAANDKGILKEVLNSNITIKKSESDISTLTPLGYAIYENNQKSIEAILGAASDKGILKEVFAGIEKDYRKKIKDLLKEAEDRDMLNEILQVERIIENEAVKANPSSDENVIPPEEEEEFVDCCEDMPQLQAEANALHSAARDGRLDIVQALLQKGADINQKDENGYTALHIATFNNNLDIVQALLNKGANVDIQANNGYTALYIATFNNNLGIVQALLEKDANVNIQKADNGYTALCVVARKGYFDIVQALLEKDADVNIQTNGGCTALHIAAVNGRTDILKSLLPKATYPLLKDIEGNTPIDLIKDESAKAKLQKLIENLKTQDTAKPSVTKPGNQNSNTVHRVEGSAIKTAIKTGLFCGGTIFVVVCFAVGSQAPILSIVGTVVAAALAVGLIASSFAYAVSKPRSEVKEADAQGPTQEQVVI